MSWVATHLVRESLADLADPSHQQRVWTSSGPPEVGSLVESVSQLFDDSGLGDALQAASMDTVFSASIDEALRELDKRANHLIARNLPPRALLMDPELVDLRQAAAGVLFAVVRLEARNEP